MHHNQEPCRDSAPARSRHKANTIGEIRLTDPVSVIQLGTVEYEEAVHLQEAAAQSRAVGACGDLLLLVQHPPVITVGRGGGWEDILAPASILRRERVGLAPTDRGGRATYHGPGQLVAYPIFQVASDDLHNFVWKLEEVGIRLLRTYDLVAGRREDHPGIWVHGRKIGAIGLAVRHGVTRHGLAINVAPKMEHFDLLIPCGIAEFGVTSMERELGHAASFAEVSQHFVQAFADVFGRQIQWRDATILPPAAAFSPAGPGEALGPQPDWLWRRISAKSELAISATEGLLRDLDLNTVCQEAHCPNIAECFGQGTATFMILGDRCTRGCRFCAVARGSPVQPDPAEPDRVAHAASQLALRHVVITSVTRDDLPDGGAGQFATTIHAVRGRLPQASIEVLIPDLNGSHGALRTVLGARPDVLNHNLETVPRLYPRVRPKASYRRSLALLASTKDLAPHILTKSGLMLGLGERTAEVITVLQELRQAQCDLLTLGQYLQPTDCLLPVARYVPPEEFQWYQDKAADMGFRGVAAGPLVRSSHRAEDLWAKARQQP